MMSLRIWLAVFGLFTVGLADYFNWDPSAVDAVGACIGDVREETAVRG